MSNTDINIDSFNVLIENEENLKDYYVANTLREVIEKIKINFNNDGVITDINDYIEMLVLRLSEIY